MGGGGGAGMSNCGDDRELNNSGTISGATGGFDPNYGGGPERAARAYSSTTRHDHDADQQWDDQPRRRRRGLEFRRHDGFGAALNNDGGTIPTLTNSGAIIGGAGGSRDVRRDGRRGGVQSTARSRL